MAFAYLLVSNSHAQTEELQYESVPQLLKTGTAAFSQGDYATAAQAFNTIRTDYAEEPEWTGTQLPNKLLPLAGFASLKANQLSDSIAALESYFAEFADNNDPNEFTRYTLASSYQKNGDSKRASTAFKTLAETTANPSIAGIAKIRLSKLLPYDEATALLDSSLQLNLASRVEVQTRLTLVRLALEAGDTNQAARNLLDTNWADAQMPELATLSFLAFQVGDQLIENKPGQALSAYRLVRPLDSLIRDQRARLFQLENVYKSRAKSLPTKLAIWADFYHSIIASLHSQLEVLSQTKDYRNSLSLRKAQCFHQSGRHMEAWLLLEQLVNSHDEDTARHAHRQWIALAQSMEAWNASASIARNYIATYPNSPDVAEALYWIAHAQLELRQHREAVASFEAVSAQTKDKNLSATAQYLAGYASYQSGDSPSAIKHLDKAIDIAAKHPIAAQAYLWKGIILSSQDRWEEASATFENVLQKNGWSHLHPEASYRIAACEFAKGEISSAKQHAESWIQNYPAHPRYSEVQLLLGDILRSEGDTENAELAYNAVQNQDRELRFYAVANLYEILLAQNRASESIALFEDFAKLDIPTTLIGDFFSLWHAALLETGKPTEAESLLIGVIETYGNNRYAHGLSELILLKFAKRETELIDLSIKAKEQSKQTLSGRALLAYANWLHSQQHSHETDAILLKLVSEFDHTELSAACLAHAGLALLEIKSIESANYFEDLLSAYPNSRHAATANFGLSKLAREKGDLEAALAFLAKADLYEISPKQNPHFFQASLFKDLGRFDEAIEIYKKFLSDKSASPRQKAETLFALGESYLNIDLDEPAYSCFQRLFTLYRGETDLVAKSYLTCANILSGQNRYEEAQLLCSELLAQSELSSESAYQLAESLNMELERIRERGNHSDES